MEFFTSQCCKAEAIIQFSDIPDFIGDDPKKQKIGTAYFVCKKCKKPCDIFPLEKIIREKKKKWLGRWTGSESVKRAGQDVKLIGSSVTPDRFAQTYRRLNVSSKSTRKDW